MARKRTEITVETESRVVLVRQAAAPIPCPLCGPDGPMVDPVTASRSLGVATREIYRWIDSGLVHFVDHDSDPTVCLHSIAQQLDRSIAQSLNRSTAQ